MSRHRTCRCWPAGSTCVLNMSEGVHVTCQALPTLLGEGPVDNSDPSMAAMLLNLVALGSLPEGPGSGLAALLGLESHADPQTLVSWVASWARLGCCVCQVGEGHPDPGSASSPLLGHRPPAPDRLQFSVASPTEHGGLSPPGPRLLAAVPRGSWNGIPGVPGQARGIGILPALSLASAGELVTWPCA